MTFSRTIMTGVSPDETSKKTQAKEDESNLALILGAVFAVLLIIVIIGALLFRRHLSKQAKVSHENISRSQPNMIMSAKNANYQGSVDKTPGNAAPQETRLSSG